MSAISFAAFCAELALGYAMSHPAPFFVALGVAGAAGVLGTAARILARDDMPLTFAEQAQLDELAAMPWPEELHHEPPPMAAHHTHARHARPGPLRRAAGRLADWWRSLRQSAPEMPPAAGDIDAWVATLRPRTWAVDALAGQINMLPAAPARLALPAPMLPATSPAGTGDGPAPVRAVTTDLGPGSEPSGATGPAPGCPSCGGPRDECWYVPGATGGPVTCPDDWHDEDASHPGDHPPIPDVPGRAPAPAHTPGPPPPPAREGGGAGPAGDLDYADDRPFTDWLRDSVAMAAVGREGT